MDREGELVTVPTGVPLRDARDQLFDAAERVLLRDGPSALTSRSVTAEAGVAKGVLHRHFDDFDAFLTQLVLNRVERVGHQSAALQGAAGAGSVVGNLADALTELYGSVALEEISLLMSRNELLARLRLAGAGQLPVINEATVMIAAYLATEQDLGRVAPVADIDALAPTLIGAGHLLFAGRRGTLPASAEVHKVVTTVLDRVIQPV